MVQLTGKEYAYNTVRRYRASLNSLKRYTKYVDIKLSQLDYKFVSDYYSYLLSEEGLQPNSAFKNIKALYRVINVAIDNKLLKENPFKDFHTKYKAPIRPYLTEVEIDRLVKAEFPSEKLCRVRDLFLVQVYTGLEPILSHLTSLY